MLGVLFFFAARSTSLYHLHVNIDANSSVFKSQEN